MGRRSALYLLARHPAELAAVRAEVAAVTGTGGLTPDHLPHLKATAQVIAETLRLYPPTALLARQAEGRRS